MQRGRPHVEVEVTIVEGEPGLASVDDEEEEEHEDSKKRGGKNGKRAPYLESMQRNLHRFMPLTPEGLYLLSKATTNDEELIAWFNEARELLYLHTILDVGGHTGWTRHVFMDRLNKRLHHLNKKSATARPENKELQDCFAKRAKTPLMRKIEAAQHDIKMCSMKGAREVMDATSGQKSEEQANIWSATPASDAQDREECRALHGRFNQDALKETKVKELEKSQAFLSSKYEELLAKHKEMTNVIKDFRDQLAQAKALPPPSTEQD
ncbi:hypothetical protein WJX75_002294 [Coccomyxa subellipsoidea]|uniref:Uncharacterized protein n=1 Tax=Coccomyxa subellipsoidea TaxID=248742 RepID=A0ABR2YAN6_9CHLO